MTQEMILVTVTEFVAFTKMKIANMDFEEKIAISHIQKCVGNSPNMVQTNKEDAILEKNVRITIPKFALIPYAKVNVSTNPVALLM